MTRFFSALFPFHGAMMRRAGSLWSCLNIFFAHFVQFSSDADQDRNQILGGLCGLSDHEEWRICLISAQTLLGTYRVHTAQPQSAPNIPIVHLFQCANTRSRISSTQFQNNRIGRHDHSRLAWAILSCHLSIHYVWRFLPRFEPIKLLSLRTDSILLASSIRSAVSCVRTAEHHAPPLRWKKRNQVKGEKRAQNAHNNNNVKHGKMSLTKTANEERNFYKKEMAVFILFKNLFLFASFAVVAINCEF